MSATKFIPRFSSSDESFPRILSLPGAGSSCGFRINGLLERYCRAHPGLSAGAIHQYRIALNLVREWGAEFCDEIFTLDGLRGFTNWLIETPHRGKARTEPTINGRCGAVWTFWTFAFEEELCDDPPPSRKKLPPLKEPEKDPVAWSVREFRKITASCRKAPPIGWFCPQHWESLLACQWYSAERIGALLQCEWTDLVGDVLVIRGETTKDKGTGINPGLPANLIEMLRSLPVFRGEAVPEGQRKLIWPLPVTVDTLRRHYKRDILVPAGLPDDAKHLFHCTRRSAITELVNIAGIERAQKKARHSHPHLTMTRYVSKAKLRGEQAANLLPSPAPQAEQKHLFE